MGLSEGAEKPRTPHQHPSREGPLLSGLWSWFSWLGGGEKSLKKKPGSVGPLTRPGGHRSDRSLSRTLWSPWPSKQHSSPFRPGEGEEHRGRVRRRELGGDTESSGEVEHRFGHGKAYRGCTTPGISSAAPRALWSPLSNLGLRTRNFGVREIPGFGVIRDLSQVPA